MSIKSTLTNGASRAKVRPEIWGMRLSLVAAACYMFMKSGAPTTGYEAIIAGLALGAAALVFEYVGASNMARSWFERRPAALLGWALLWIGAFVYSANNWLGAASDTEAGKANMQKAAYVSYDDGRKDLTAARDRVAADESTLKQLKAMSWQELPKIAGKPVASAEAARVIMDAAREGSTRHTQAAAAFADLKQREKWGEDIKRAEAQLEISRAALQAAGAKAAATKVTTTEDRTDLHFYKAYFGMSDRTAQDMQAALKIGVVSLFISLFAWLHIGAEYAGKPRQPWFNWRAWIARGRRAWDGTEVNNSVVTKLDGYALTRGVNGEPVMTKVHALA